jgi:hypothetical protein
VARIPATEADTPFVDADDEPAVDACVGVVEAGLLELELLPPHAPSTIAVVAAHAMAMVRRAR